MKGYRMIFDNIAIFDTDADAARAEDEYIIIDGDLYSKEWKGD